MSALLASCTSQEIDSSFKLVWNKAMADLSELWITMCQREGNLKRDHKGGSHSSSSHASSHSSSHASESVSHASSHSSSSGSESTVHASSQNSDSELSAPSHDTSPKSQSEFVASGSDSKALNAPENSGEETNELTQTQAGDGKEHVVVVKKVLVEQQRHRASTTGPYNNATGIFNSAGFQHASAMTSVLFFVILL
ncbi:hypothetical protein BC830DRAFT_1177749 [Chytriomyces sp. MP71]|nr:hypothetical protein BC830DRAFT_1177749 [Chytriomyces sp. MP71]